ncbi:hypothetical protein [Halorubrum halophilum]|uniref:hypothetical protein n=1 Tax=Halorubrum halophilum TaxID=413816 RepID=UPI00186B02A7|nr:hypothetical protein [Halorubrum halophilum]
MDLLTAYNGALLRIGLYLLIFWPTVGYYVYQDTKNRGRSSPHLRGAVYGFFGILGLVAYISRRTGDDASDS